MSPKVATGILGNFYFVIGVLVNFFLHIKHFKETTQGLPGRGLGEVQAVTFSDSHKVPFMVLSAGAINTGESYTIHTI